MACCKRIKQIGDFNEDWKSVVLAIKTKEELRDRLQKATLKFFDWSDLIIRLTAEIGNLLNGLPEDIKKQYLQIRLRDSYEKKWQEAVTNNNKEEADVWLLKYKDVFKCHEEEDCECRKNNNGQIS